MHNFFLVLGFEESREERTFDGWGKAREKCLLVAWWMNRSQQQGESQGLCVSWWKGGFCEQVQGGSRPEPFWTLPKAWAVSKTIYPQISVLMAKSTFLGEAQLPVFHYWKVINFFPIFLLSKSSSSGGSYKLMFSQMTVKICPENCVNSHSLSQLYLPALPRAYVKMHIFYIGKWKLIKMIDN